jgi:ribosomal protein L35
MVAKYRNENTGVFQVDGRLIGLREIGTRKSWFRWRVPGGEKFRSAKAALSHIQQQIEESEKRRVTYALTVLSKRWHARLECA